MHLAEAILDGRQPAALTVTRLKQFKAPPMPWEEQHQALGFSDTV